MNYKYRLSDFKKIERAEDTDIKERIVSINLANVSELPSIIVQRLENIINNMISEYEQAHNTLMPLDTMDLGIYLDVDTMEKELYFHTYIGYSVDEECLDKKEIITVFDKDYQEIKKYFLVELNHFVFTQIRKIENCA